MKKIIKTLSITLVAIALAGCDKEMYFSEDVIIDDIVTLDQSKVGNKIEMTVGTTRKINVQNAKGNVSATPADKAIVTVSVYKYEYRYPELTLSAETSGETEIVIKDEKGKTAKLYVKVAE